jgi:CRISPR-associated endonuclease/helicase Cas3
MDLQAVPLAHSARPAQGIPAQPYPVHISNVTTESVDRAKEAGKFAPKYGGLLQVAVGLGAEFHDLGKLDTLNQHVLCTSTRKLEVRHEDAGTACILSQSVSDFHRQLAAFLVYSHHRGLPSYPEETNREEDYLRDSGAGPDGKPLRQLTDKRLETYLETHRAFVTGLPTIDAGVPADSIPQLLCRIALSCLVDADHSDTAHHYHEDYGTKPQPLQASERLAALDRYVAKLARSKTDERSRIRQAIYKDCLEQDPTSSCLWECDSPVGTGKTTAVMAHLLRAAEVKKLRRVFVVLPFTNIIDQAVGVYRKSLVLPGEDPETVVAAHHHRADYAQLDSRHLASLWRAPIVVTTAVQFFETLAARSTGGLRKLHELVGSGVFIDESHASLPAKLWPQAWDWIRQLAADWGCHFVLGSGSLNRIWSMPEFMESRTQDLPALVQSGVRPEAALAEEKRVRIRTLSEPLTLGQLVNWLETHKGPRIVIVNTVQIAAALAKLLAEKNGRDAVMHLSTSLTPNHRALTLDLVKTRLDDRTDTNWTLVATSCVEAGVDLSFRNGFRQRSSLCSLLQLCGRVRRNEEYPDAEVWDFVLVAHDLVNENRDLRDASDVLGLMFKENKVGPEHCTEALAREIRLGRGAELNKELRKAEESLDFPKVQELFRVISQETKTVVVSQSLQDRLKRWEAVDWQELQKHSVQVYADKVDNLGLESAPGMADVYFWNLPYDDFLGYMKGVLPLVEGQLAGGFIY